MVSSVFIGEPFMGFSLTCSKMFTSLRCGLGDGEGKTGVFNGLLRICLLINKDMLNFLLLSVLCSSGEGSLLSTGYFSVEFLFCSAALDAMLALDSRCGCC